MTSIPHRDVPPGHAPPTAPTQRLDTGCAPEHDVIGSEIALAQQLEHDVGSSSVDLARQLDHAPGRAPTHDEMADSGQRSETPPDRIRPFGGRVGPQL
jgi:hypothetical protein